MIWWLPTQQLNSQMCLEEYVLEEGVYTDKQNDSEFPQFRSYYSFFNIEP